MRFVIFSDAHFCLKHLQAASASLLFIQDYCVREKPEAVFFAGDLLDSRTQIHTKVFMQMCEILSGFRHNPRGDFSGTSRIHCILGNHDLYTDNLGQSVLDYLPNITTYNTPGGMPFGAARFFFMPWLRELVADIKVPSKHDYLIGHVESRLLLQDYSRYGRLIDQIKHKAFLGHIHHPGEVHPKIEILGPTFRTSFAEEHIQPRFIVLDTESNTFESINVPSPIYKTLNYGEEVPKNVISRVKVPNHISKKEALKRYAGSTFLFDTKKNIEKQDFNVSSKDNQYFLNLNEIIDTYVETTPTELDKSSLKNLGQRISSMKETVK